MKHPSAVTACNLDLENLVTDSNRSIATLAITTLLKTGSESSIDRLMKQISSFMSEISDEFKVRMCVRRWYTGCWRKPSVSVHVCVCFLKPWMEPLPAPGLQRFCWEEKESEAIRPSQASVIQYPAPKSGEKPFEY